jgi:hypothetical protein
MSKTWKKIESKYKANPVTFSRLAVKAMERGCDPRNTRDAYEAQGREMVRRQVQAERAAEARRKAKQQRAMEAMYMTGDSVGRIDELLKAVTDQHE